MTTRITREKLDSDIGEAYGAIDIGIGIFDITASDSSGGRAIMAKGQAPKLEEAKRNALHATGKIARNALGALEG